MKNKWVVGGLMSIGMGILMALLIAIILNDKVLTEGLVYTVDMNDPNIIFTGCAADMNAATLPFVEPIPCCYGCGERNIKLLHEIKLPILDSSYGAANLIIPLCSDCAVKWCGLLRKQTDNFNEQK